MLGHSARESKLALLMEAGLGKSIFDWLLLILYRDGDNASYFLKLAAAGVVLLGALYAAATALT